MLKKANTPSIVKSAIIAITALITTALMMNSYANLSIVTDQAKEQHSVLSNSAANEPIVGYVNMPLSDYLKQIYSGYTVKLDQVKDVNIIIENNDNVLNDASSILNFLSTKYQLNFKIDQPTQQIIVSPQDNVAEESYKAWLDSLNKERASIAQEKIDLEKYYQQKTSDFKTISDANFQLSIEVQDLKKAGEDLKTELVKLHHQFKYVISDAENKDISNAIDRWQDLNIKYQNKAKANDE